MENHLEKKVRQVYVEIFCDEANLRSSEFVIELCGRNLEIFEPNTFVFKSAPFNELLMIYCQYAISLWYTKEFKKSLPVLNRAIELFDIDKGENSFEKLKYPQYERLYWLRAWALYETKKHKDSRKDSNMLLLKYPEKTPYKKLSLLLIGYRLRVIQFWLLGFMICNYLVSYCFKYKDFQNLRNAMFWSAMAALCGMLLIFIIDSVLKRKYIKMK
ncbi:hypothetical protein BH09BAC5_BH09BAC5_18040 [soil metagenome]